jgi:rhodanese-related sulfurtransferase
MSMRLELSPAAGNHPPPVIRSLGIFLLFAAAFNGGASSLPSPVGTSDALHNVWRVTSNVFSGSQPNGEAGFAALEHLGIRTVLSVDGAIPDIETAKRHGIRTIHLPVGYDGIPISRVTELARVATSVEGPIYVHCHHGRHRGPAAAAVLCLSAGNWTPAEAATWLHAAGTSTNYTGLYRSVLAFHPPDADQLALSTNALPEVAIPRGMVQSMVWIDDCHEQLKSCRDAGWATPVDQPDLHPAHAVLMLREQFRELRRAPATRSRPPGFIRQLHRAEAAAAGLQEALQTGDFSQGNRRFDEISASCRACHQAYRD